METQVYLPAIPYRAAYSWSLSEYSVDIHVTAHTAMRAGKAEHIQHYLAYGNKILLTHFHVSTYVRTYRDVCTIQRYNSLRDT